MRPWMLSKQSTGTGLSTSKPAAQAMAHLGREHHSARRFTSLLRSYTRAVLPASGMREQLNSLYDTRSSGKQSNSAGSALPPGCYVGPRGGAYTITKSGRKNYSGC